MEPEQERLSKLYSGSGIHSLPELNPNLNLHSAPTHEPRPVPTVSLPGNAIDLVELIYGIDVMGCINYRQNVRT